MWHQCKCHFLADMALQTTNFVFVESTTIVSSTCLLIIVGCRMSLEILLLGQAHFGTLWSIIDGILSSRAPC